MASRFLTITASTKRPPALASGKRGDAVAFLTSVACGPLDPFNEELALRDVLQTPHTLRATFVGIDTDIASGDVLTVAGVDYPVRIVEAYAAQGPIANFKRVVVEVFTR